MDMNTAHILNKVNKRFYRDNAVSFDATRQAPWQGWLACADAIEDCGLAVDGLRVCDLACGNLRFERYLAERFADSPLQVTALDSCDELATAADLPKAQLSYHSVDIVASLLSEDRELAQILSSGGFDVVACFGFMHHVPGERNRRHLMQLLCDSCRPGGLVLVSFWDFLENPRLAKKARAATAEALATPRLGRLAPLLEANDCFLGWKATKGSYRYCHSFYEDEVGALAAGLATRTELVSLFRADGREGKLNIYLILRAL